MMKKINTFLHVFKNSLFPLEPYYKKIPKTPLSFSFKYFVILLFIYNTLMLAVLFVRYMPLISQSKSTYFSIEKSLQTYPSDLVIDVNRGQVSINRDEPVFMWLEKDGIQEPIVVADKQALVTDFDQYQTRLLIASNGVALNIDSSPQYYYFSLRDSFTIDKNLVNTMIETMHQVYSKLPLYVMFAGIVGVIILPLFAIGLNMIMLLIISLPVFLIANYFLAHKHVTFKKVFQISLHAVTIPLALDYIFLAIGIPMGIPFGSVLLYSLFLVAGMYEIYAFHKKK